LTGITTIGAKEFQPRKSIVSSCENKQRTVTILKIADVNDHHQEKTQRINQDVPLTTVYPLVIRFPAS